MFLTIILGVLVASELVSALSSILGKDVAPTASNAHVYRQSMTDAVNQIYNLVGSRKDELMTMLDQNATPEAVKAKEMLGSLYKPTKLSGMMSQIYGQQSTNPIQAAASKIDAQAQRADAVDAAKTSPLGEVLKKVSGSMAPTKEDIDSGKFDPQTKQWMDSDLTGEGTTKPIGPISDRVAQYKDSASKIATQVGVDPSLVLAVINRESGGDPNAKSKKGATGLMQLMPGTAEELGVDANNPEENIFGGASYLKKMIDQFGNLTHALVAYNWGPGNAQKWLAKGGKFANLPKETRDYVASVTETYKAIA
jgi:soluble lytic murein transglycosylase-like protein